MTACCLLTVTSEHGLAGGADALALSPLHALFTADPTRFGPYSPSTRLFLNPLHAAPGLVFGEQHVAQAIAEAGLGDAFARLEALKLIEWPEAAAAKLALLRVLFEDFMAEPEANGPLATDFALFRADGEFEREFLGNTPYGGGGVLEESTDDELG